MQIVLNYCFNIIQSKIEGQSIARKEKVQNNESNDNTITNS